MGKVFTMAFKDLRILKRDKAAVFWVVMFPLIYALFFGSIFSGGGSTSSMKIAIIDHDHTDYSARFIEKVKTLEGIRVDTTVNNVDSATQKVRLGKLTAFIVLKKGFGSGMGMFSKEPIMQIGIDPARRAERGYLEGMLTQASFSVMMQNYMSAGGAKKEFSKIRESVPDWNMFNDSQKAQAQGAFDNIIGLFDQAEKSGKKPGGVPEDSTGDTALGKYDAEKMMQNRIETVSITNDTVRPRTSFDITFPSSILWGLIACATTFGVSIVKERTGGTFLRLRLSPITRAHILAGKGLACFITSVFVCVVLLAVGILIFGVEVSSPTALLLGILASSFGFVGIMMLISVLGKTEQAVGGAGWAIMLVFAMSGGGMIPIFFMPSWLKAISNFSPVKWGIFALEGGIWRQFTLSEMMLPVGVLVGIGLAGYFLGVYILSRSDG